MLIPKDLTTKNFKWNTSEKIWKYTGCKKSFNILDWSSLSLQHENIFFDTDIIKCTMC